MNIKTKSSSGNYTMVNNLFFRLLPIQILIIAMGSVDSLIDGVISGRYIAPAVIGVIGLFYTMIQILQAIGSVMLGGSSVLCGKYMGSGEMDKTNGIFSLDLAVTFICGALFSLLTMLLPGTVARWLGASEGLLEVLSFYTFGYSFCIIPQLLAQQLGMFLQLERQEKRGYLGIAVMVISNLICDLYFIVYRGLGVTGLNISNIVSNGLYFLVLVSYYFTDKAQLKFSFKNIYWHDLPQLIKIGFPGALLIFCLAFKNLALNRILLTYANESSISALSSYNMLSGLILAFALGAGSVLRILASIFIGEEDRESIFSLMKLLYTKGMAIMTVIGILVALFSAVLASMYFPDHSSTEFLMSRQLFIINGLCTPLALFCIISSNYLQASGHNLIVNIISVFDGFLSNIIPAMILAPKYGASGVWYSIVLGLIMTALIGPLYSIFVNRHMPKDAGEWLMLDPSFGAGERLILSLEKESQIANTAVEVQNFCKANGVDEKMSYYAALCLEEMAGNVVQHGFNKDNRDHNIDIRVILLDPKVLLRIKDDCVPFDPKERADLVTPDDPLKNIGIRMTYQLADEVTYQNLLGLNVLTIDLERKPAV